MFTGKIALVNAKKKKKNANNLTNSKIEVSIIKFVKNPQVEALKMMN